MIAESFSFARFLEYAILAAVGRYLGVLVACVVRLGLALCDEGLITVNGTATGRNASGTAAGTSPVEIDLV
jgi:hypothetical protein